MRKKTLCIDARMINHSGIGTFIQNILKAAPSYHDLAVSLLIDPCSRKEHPYLDNFDLISFKSPIYSPFEQIKYPVIIPSCDLFWSPHINAPILPTRAKKRLVTIHDMYHITHPSDFSYLKNLYVKLLYNSAVKQADQIVTVSNFSKNELFKFYSTVKDKVEVIYNGVDKELFSSQKSSSELLLPEKYFLFVGSIKPHKNLKRLVEAFSRVIEKHPEYHLVIVGKKEGLIHQESFGHLLSNETVFSRVHFFHDIPNRKLPGFYSNAEALVFPSLYEGFGLPPLEAMQCRCPVLASNIASIPEVCGDAALYFDPYKSCLIEAAMCKMIEQPNLKLDLIEKGLNRVSRFEWKVATQKYFELVRRMIYGSSSCS